MSSFDDLDETKAKRKLHAYDKEAKAKSKIEKTLSGLFLIKKTAKKKRTIYKSCSIGTCSTYNVNTKGFYQVPEHSLKRSDWLDACKLPPTSTANSATICWNHF